MASELEEFQAFMRRRDAAAHAYVTGEAAPLGDMVTHVDPATFFPPGGGVQQGADPVWERYDGDVDAFEAGGDSRLEILHMQASDGLAYWVGLQHAHVRMKGKPELVPFELRITELFRREHGSWRLIHRHADPLAKPKPRGG
jgi:ketosteroid isomerase-like protein